MNETFPNKSQEVSQNERQSKYEQVRTASPDIVLAAAQTEIDRLGSLLQGNNTLGRSERDGLLKDIRGFNAVKAYAQEWQRESMRFSDVNETFSDFVDQKIDEAIELDEDEEMMDKLSQVNSLVGGEAYERIVGDMLDVAAESDEAPDVTVEPVDVYEESTSEVSQARQAATQAEARQSVESLYENIELFDDIVTFAKNKTAINVDAKGGYQSVGDIGRVQANDLEVISQDVQTEQSKIGFIEAATFTQLQEYDQREVTVQVGWEKKNRFSKQVPKMGTKFEDIPGSEHPLMIVNPDTDQKEPTVRFRYKFGYEASDMQRVYDGELPRYQSFNDPRDGQCVRLGIDLPKSIADKLQEQMKTDPATVRTLVEKLALSNNNGNINEKYWNKGEGNGRIKPPYELLPDDWTIAVVTGYEVKQYNHPQFVDYTVDRLTLNH